MFAAVCVRYLEIKKKQVKLTLLINLLIALLILFITPVIFGINNLDNISSAFVLERFISLIGIVLLTPIFLPEQDKNIAELVESKYTSCIKIYLIRFILSIISLFIFISGFIVFMVLMSCEFDTLKFILGTFATAFFLGSIGFITSAVSNNVVFGYMASLGYYVFNMFNSSKLKNLYLFSLGKGSFTEKYWLLGIGAAFIFSGALFKHILRKLR
jgi:hypothetical protein